MSEEITRKYRRPKHDDTWRIPFLEAIAQGSTMAEARFYATVGPTSVQRAMEEDDFREAVRIAKMDGYIEWPPL